MMKKLFCTIIILFVAGCANSYYPESASSDEFITEMRMQQTEQQLQQIQQERLYESFGLPLLP